MYHHKKDTLTKSSHKYTLHKEDQQLRYSDFLTYLQQDESFRAFFIELLSEVPFRAYHWETPSVTSGTVGQPFEFVVTNSPGIDLPARSGPFQQYFTSGEVVVFDNLGSDAMLIAPTPAAKSLNYSHIGVFTSEAPMSQQHAFWQRVGQVTEEQVSDQPLWLNTAGGGVAWLHVRLDLRPKYYRHRAYTIME